MRRLKAVLLGVLAVLVWVLFVPALGSAQQGGGPPAQRGRRERPDLGLSQTQRQQIRQIRQEGREHAQAIRNDSSLSPEQRKAQLRQLRKETHKKVEAILTPEQRAKLRQFRKERRGGPGGRGPQGQPPPPQDPGGPGGR
jgi:Spy/CpxP family protein refolding chaperone